MSLALYASPYDNNGIDNSTDNLISRKRLNHNKTQKYYNKDNNQTDKVKNIIKKIHDNSLYNDPIDGVEMGDFSPLSPPESSGVTRTIDKSNFKENYSGMDDNNDSDNDNYTYINSNKSNNVNALQSSGNSNYYTIPSNSNLNSSMQPQSPNQPNQQNQSNQQNQQNQQNQSNQPNQPDASNYLDNIEYNNLNNNYADNKSVEEYYKKFSPNYSYGAVSNWNRTAQSQAQTNMNNINKKIYANDSTNANIYNSYNNPYSPSNPTNTENTILIEKLNYMIHLLEEQHDERTNNVTEEVILYCFLGVFMIFIVDSFTRVGKYVR